MHVPFSRRQPGRRSNLAAVVVTVLLLALIAIAFLILPPAGAEGAGEVLAVIAPFGGGVTVGSALSLACPSSCPT